MPKFLYSADFTVFVKYYWELTSPNCVIIDLTLKEGCSLSKVSKVTTLKVNTRFSVALLFHGYFSPQSPTHIDAFDVRNRFLLFTYIQ